MKLTKDWIWCSYTPGAGGKMMCSILQLDSKTHTWHIELDNELDKFINEKILKAKLVLVSTLIVVALISIPIISMPGNTFLKHVLEWDYFLGVIAFYLLTFFMWKKQKN